MFAKGAGNTVLHFHAMGHQTHHESQNYLQRPHPSHSSVRPIDFSAMLELAGNEMLFRRWGTQERDIYNFTHLLRSSRTYPTPLVTTMPRQTTTKQNTLTSTLL